MKREMVIAGNEIPSGSRKLIELPLPKLYTQSPLTMPVHVIRGKADGPRVFVCAAIHGDELNGIEIVRRLLKSPVLKRLRGTLIAVPIVNIYGLIQQSRYLPDRRDLNRSFPGSEKGSLAARLAELFMSEIVANCTHGIDLHTGAIHRKNLPQIRANIDDDETARLANSFGVPVIINSTVRDGSLREAASDLGIPMLLYEAGEALRLDEVAIRAGVTGINNVLRALGMLPVKRSKRKTAWEPFIARSSSWIRASASGLFRKVASLGSRVETGELLGLIDDPFTGAEIEVTAKFSGIVIGCTEIPMVHQGDAIFHIARFEEINEIAERLETFQILHCPEEDPAQNNAGEEPPVV